MDDQLLEIELLYLNIKGNIFFEVDLRIFLGIKNLGYINGYVYNGIFVYIYYQDGVFIIFIVLVKKILKKRIYLSF